MKKFKTIHIKDVTGKQQPIIKKLFKKLLFSDNSFHYFFEADDIIIRTNDKNTLKNIDNFLNYDFEIYDYPFPGFGKYGEGKRSITAKHLDLFLSLYHTICVANFIMKDNDFWQFLRKGLHGAFNIKNKSHFKEIQFLANYLSGVIKVIERVVGSNYGNLEEKLMLKNGKTKV